MTLVFKRVLLITAYMQRLMVNLIRQVTSYRGQTGYYNNTR